MYTCRCGSSGNRVGAKVIQLLATCLLARVLSYSGSGHLLAVCSVTKTVHTSTLANVTTAVRRQYHLPSSREIKFSASHSTLKPFKSGRRRTCAARALFVCPSILEELTLTGKIRNELQNNSNPGGEKWTEQYEVTFRVDCLCAALQQNSNF